MTLRERVKERKVMIVVLIGNDQKVTSKKDREFEISTKGR